MALDAFSPSAPPAIPPDVGPYSVTATGSTTARTLAARSADDVNTRDETTLALAIARANSTGNPLVIRDAITISTALGTISAPVRWEGGKFVFNVGGTVGLTGPQTGGLGQRFALGTAADFSGLTSVGAVAEVYPQWWGAAGDGAHDDQPATQGALNALIGKGGIVAVPPGNYYLATPVVLDTRHESISLIGRGWGRGANVPAPVRFTCASTCIKTATSGAFQPNGATPLYGLEISDVLFVGQTGHDHLVSLNGIFSGRFRNVHTSGATVGKDNFQISNFVHVEFDGFNVAGAGRYGINLGSGASPNSSTTLRMRGGYIKNARDAGIWAAGANQLSHVMIKGTLVEQSGRAGDGSTNGGLGYGLVIDNAEDVDIDLYAEANTTADAIIGGTPTNTSGAFTVGSGCRSVRYTGYHQGQAYAGTAVREGLKLAKVDGIDIAGFFDAYTYSHIAIDDANTGAVKHVRFGPTVFSRLGSAYVRDAGGRLALGTSPSQWTLPETAYYSVTPATLTAGLDLHVLTAAGADSAALPAATRTGEIITVANQGAGTKTITGAAAGSVTIAQGVVKRFEYDVAWGLWSSMQ